MPALACIDVQASVGCRPRSVSNHRLWCSTMAGADALWPSRLRCRITPDQLPRRCRRLVLFRSPLSCPLALAAACGSSNPPPQTGGNRWTRAISAIRAPCARTRLDPAQHRDREQPARRRGARRAARRRQSAGGERDDPRRGDAEDRGHGAGGRGPARDRDLARRPVGGRHQLWEPDRAQATR